MKKQTKTQDKTGMVEAQRWCSDVSDSIVGPGNRRGGYKNGAQTFAGRVQPASRSAVGQQTGRWTWSCADRVQTERDQRSRAKFGYPGRGVPFSSLHSRPQLIDTKCAILVGPTRPRPGRPQKCARMGPPGSPGAPSGPKWADLACERAHTGHGEPPVVRKWRI